MRTIENMIDYKIRENFNSEGSISWIKWIVTHDKIVNEKVKITILNRLVKQF